MRSIRRVGALAAAGILLTAVATGPASAQTTTPASYSGTASGAGLSLKLGPQGLTAGSSAAKAASDGTGEATGAGILNPIEASTVATIKNPPGGTLPRACGDDALNAIEEPLGGLLTLGLGCGEASATGTGAASTATATGTVGALGLDVSSILGQVPTEPLLEGIGTITTQLGTLCGAIPLPPGTLPLDLCQAGNVVTTVVESITASQLLGATLGSSTSGVTVSGTNVTSKATSSAAVIELLPVPLLGGVTLTEPLATISVSGADATVVCDTGTGNATPSFVGSIVTVDLGETLTALLPVELALPVPVLGPQIPANPVIAPVLAPDVSLQGGTLTITPGATVTLLPGTPLQTTITVGSGTSKVNPDGSASATADGVKIALLEKIGDVPQLAALAGGVALELAHAEATGACVAATTTAAPVEAPLTPTAVETPRELPRTGGDSTPWLPVAAVAALAVAVVSRRALTRSN